MSGANAKVSTEISRRDSSPLSKDKLASPITAVQNENVLLPLSLQMELMIPTYKLVRL